MTVIEGVDYAWSVPSAASLAAAGKRFAVRYGGPGGGGKQLQADELTALRAAGVDVVANAEGAAGGFTGFAAGASWARSAQVHFDALGMPPDRPIYFSVDWNPGSGDWAGIDAACRGAASVIGADRVGVYGGYATIAHCRSAGTAAWFWQTYAWSGTPTRWHPACHLQQYRNGVTIGGADLDLTRAVQDDYGQWGADMPLTEPEWTRLAGIVNAAYANSSKDAIPETTAGHWVLSQGIPDGTNAGQRAATWQVLENLGAEVVALQAQVAAIGTVAVTADQLEAAFLAALKQLAAEASTGTSATRE